MDGKKCKNVSVGHLLDRHQYLPGIVLNHCMVQYAALHEIAIRRFL